MRTTIIFVHPLHTFPPRIHKKVNQSTCLEAVNIIWTHIVISGIRAILILLLSN